MGRDAYRTAATMTLEEAIAKLDTLDEDADEDEDVTLYVREPWTASSECVAAPSGSNPAGFRYFLEVSIIREVLEGIEGTDIDPIVRVIHYAEYDA